MRTNFWKVSMFALAATMMAACSQNDELTSEMSQPENQVLEVKATIQDYAPEVEGRVVDTATNDGYTTTFEQGDEIGVFAILDNGEGEVMKKNLKMTYNATSSKFEADAAAPLYFYRNAKYIAYSPYNASLSITENTVDAIKTWFTTNVATGTYEERDLMTAEVTSGTDITQTSLNFSFAHAMSMVEFVLPVAQYKTTDGYEYCGPIFGIELTMKNGTADEETITPLSLGKGVYRYLLTPDATASYIFGGTAYVGDGTQPVYFTTQTAFVPTAGKFKKVNITYTGAPSTDVTTRDIAVGDYFYADGGIVPGDATTVPTRNLVGIVFSTETCTADQGRGWKKGYVVASAAAVVKWNDLSINTHEALSKPDDETTSEYTTFYEKFIDLDVFEMTTEATRSYLNKPELWPEISTTSGWYVPGPGHFIEMLKNLGDDTSTGSYFSKPDDGRKNAINKLFSYKYLEEWKGHVWTCYAESDGGAWDFRAAAGNDATFMTRNKAQNQSNSWVNPHYVRPIFAF